MRYLLVALVATVAAMPFALASEPAAPEVVNATAEGVTVHQQLVAVGEGMDGFLAYAPFRQQPYTTGYASDVLEVRFDKPVVVLGVSISVDVDQRWTLLEFSVGKNWDHYIGNTLGSLLHVSSQGDPIDERIWFDGYGFDLEPGDHLAVTAWLYNDTGDVLEVHPETTIWFVPQS